MNPIVRLLGVVALACGGWAAVIGGRSPAADIGELVVLGDDAAGHTVATPVSAEPLPAPGPAGDAWAGR